MTDEVEIKGNVAKNENVCFFTTSIQLLENLKVECHSEIEAKGSPLFIELFRYSWVQEVAAEGRALIVRKKDSSGPWSDYAPMVAAVVRQLYREKTPFFSDQFVKAVREKKKTTDSKKPVPFKINQANVNSPLGKRIQKILDEHVTPSLAGHGGYAAMVDLAEGKVYLYLGGGCQGCSQASNTVKLGIEKLLLREFPELISVEDVTDHVQGKNPYYK